MISPIEIIRVTVKTGIDIPSTDYAQLLYKGEEIGFISNEGIFLKMYHPQILTGVFQKLNVFENEPFSRKCSLIQKHWEAIYDRYTTIIRGK